MSTTSSTRAYCMNATRRSSPPRSSAIPTIPDAPPATMPSAAVRVSAGVQRARATPAARLMTSVPRLARATGSHASPIADSALDCR